MLLVKGDRLLDTGNHGNQNVKPANVSIADCKTTINGGERSSHAQAQSADGTTGHSAMSSFSEGLTLLRHPFKHCWSTNPANGPAPAKQSAAFIHSRHHLNHQVISKSSLGGFHQKILAKRVKGWSSSSLAELESSSQASVELQEVILPTAEGRRPRSRSTPVKGDLRNARAQPIASRNWSTDELNSRHCIGVTTGLQGKNSRPLSLFGSTSELSILAKKQPRKQSALSFHVNWSRRPSIALSRTASFAPADEGIEDVELAKAYAFMQQRNRFGNEEIGVCSKHPQTMVSREGQLAWADRTVTENKRSFSSKKAHFTNHHQQRRLKEGTLTTGSPHVTFSDLYSVEDVPSRLLQNEETCHPPTPLAWHETNVVPQEEATDVWSDIPWDGFCYYFAYGMEMNSDRLSALLEWQTLWQRPAVLPDQQLCFNKIGEDKLAGRFPNIQALPGGKVEGCLYIIPDNRLALLNKALGCPKHYFCTKLYVKISQLSQHDACLYSVRAFTHIAQKDWTSQADQIPISRTALSHCLKDMIHTGMLYIHHRAKRGHAPSTSPYRGSAATVAVIKKKGNRT